MAARSRIFIDTNVWFSAFYGSPHAERIIKAHIEGKIQAIISKQVLDELVRNISAKIPHAVIPLKNLLEATPPLIVADPQGVPQKLGPMVQRKDQSIMASAIRSKVTIFVTGNTKDFAQQKLKDAYGILVLTPKEAVKLLKL